MEAVVPWRESSWTLSGVFPHWKSRVLWFLISATLVLNLLDGALTVLWVELGVAEEANLLLRDLIEVSAVHFMVVKLSLVSLGLGLLWRHRTHGLAVGGLWVSFAAYSVLLLVHLHIARVYTAIAFG